MNPDVTWLAGVKAGKEASAQKVKEAFNSLPKTADNATKDLLLDLYNEIKQSE